ncbi:hypothetical protein BKA81DRAFT_39588 [Phyllosticta paracitricarpa]
MEEKPLSDGDETSFFHRVLPGVLVVSNFQRAPARDPSHRNLILGGPCTDRCEISNLAPLRDQPFFACEQMTSFQSHPAVFKRIIDRTRRVSPLPSQCASARFRISPTASSKLLEFSTKKRGLETCPQHSSGRAFTTAIVAKPSTQNCRNIFARRWSFVHP